MTEGAKAIIDIGTNRAAMLQTRRQWVPEGNARALVLMIHSLGDHSERYGHVGSAFARAGIGAVAFDLRGHGTSEGTRAHIDSFEEYLDDVQDQIDQLKTFGVPVTILGFGLGALIAVQYCLSERRQPDYLVLSCPPIESGLAVWQRYLLSNIAKISPKTFIPLNVDLNKLCSDPEIVEAYKKDPLTQLGATSTLLNQIMLSQKELHSRIEELDIDTLCFHGRDDELIKPRASIALDDLECVERKLLWGLRHEVFNEPGAEAISTTIDWITARVAP